MSVRVITDSASAIPPDELARLRIGVVSLYVNDAGSVLRETDIERATFYRRLADMASLPTTSQPSPEDFAAVFSEAVSAGDEVLAVLISSKMSGTVRSAELAVALVQETNPKARIVVVDSESNSMQEGFAVLAAAERAAAGGSLEECEAAARATIPRSRFLFAPRSLEYLRRGGRISGAASFVGVALHVVPILTAKGGTTGVAGAARSEARALERMAAIMRADVARYGYERALIQSIAADDEAAAFGRSLIEPIAGGPVPVVPVGVTVGLHVGPAVAVVYQTVEPLR